MMRSTVLYCKVYKNKIVIKNLFDTNVTIIADRIFSNETYLLAELEQAVTALKGRRKEILGKRIMNFFFQPLVLVQPMELSSKKLSEVERALLMGLIQNAKITTDPVVWHGKELSDDEVFSKFPTFRGRSFRLYERT